MRNLLILVLAAAALWAGYWFFGSYALESKLVEWGEERRTAGWQLEYEDLSVNGFPNRFDVTVSTLNLTDPNTGLSWVSPFFQTLMLSYNPKHMIFVWPNNQTISTPYQKIDVSSENMKASVVTMGDGLVTIERATTSSDFVKLTSSSNWSTGLTGLTSSIRKVEGDTSYEIAGHIDSISPTKNFLRRLTDIVSLPRDLTNIDVRAKLELSDQINRKLLEVGRPQIKKMALERFSATWGQSQVKAIGDVVVDAQGRITGELLINARNWEDLLEAAQISGSISSEISALAKNGLNLMARLSGATDSIEVPLTFRAGRMSLGPIPLGQAPRLKIR